MLHLKTALAANDDGTLTTFLITQFDSPVDLSHHGRIFRFPCFENLSNTRQTTGDVRNSGRFTRCFRNCGTLLDLGTFFNRNVGTLWQVVHVQRVAFFVFDHDLRMQVAFEVDDRTANRTRSFLLHLHRFAFDDVLEAYFTFDF